MAELYIHCTFCLLGVGVMDEVFAHYEATHTLGGFLTPSSSKFVEMENVQCFY